MINSMDKQYVSEAVDRALSELEPLNRDFFKDLPEVICQILNDLNWKWGTYPWFNKAWEEYRKHVLDAGLGGKIKMPGFVFNSYIKEQIEKDAKAGKSIYHSEVVDDILEHHGIKGQRWGIRRYQNEDGTLTADGKARRDRENYQKAAGTAAGTLIGATFGIASALQFRLPNKKDKVSLVSRNPAITKRQVLGRALTGAIIGGFVGKKISDIRANNQRAKEWKKFQNKAVENQINK